MPDRPLPIAREGGDAIEAARRFLLDAQAGMRGAGEGAAENAAENASDQKPAAAAQPQPASETAKPAEGRLQNLLDTLKSQYDLDQATLARLKKMHADGKLSENALWDLALAGPRRHSLVEPATLRQILNLKDDVRAAALDILSDMLQASRKREPGLSRETFALLIAGEGQAEVLRAYRDAIGKGVLNDEAVKTFAKRHEPYRRVFESFLTEGLLDRDSADRLLAGDIKEGIRLETLERYRQALKAKVLDKESFRKLLAMTNADRGAFDAAIVAEELKRKDARLLKPSDIVQLADLGPESAAGYYKALATGTISKGQFDQILSHAPETRQAFDRAMVQGLLDGRSVDALLRANADATAVDSFVQCVLEARKNGITPRVFKESIERIRKVREQTAELNSLTPTREAQLALLMHLHGNDLDNPSQVVESNRALDDVLKLKAELDSDGKGGRVNAGLDEVLHARAAKAKIPGITISGDTVQDARKIMEMVNGERINGVSTMKFEDALVAAASCGHIPRAVREAYFSDAVASLEGLYRAHRANPGIKFADLCLVANAEHRLSQLLGKETAAEFAKIKFKDPAKISTIVDGVWDYAFARFAAADETARRAGPRDRVRLEREALAWEQICKVLEGRHTGPYLVRSLEAEGELAWQQARGIKQESLGPLSGERLGDLMQSVTQRRLRALAGEEASDVVRKLFEEARARTKEGLEGPARERFMKGWLNVAAHTPAREQQAAFFAILKSSRPSDFACLKDTDLQRLAGSITIQNLNHIAKTDQARLLVALMREVDRRPELRASFSLSKKLMDKMTPDLIDCLAVDDLKWFREQVKARAAAGETPELKPTTEYVRSISGGLAGDGVSKDLLNRLLRQFSGEDRALALQVLHERAGHLSLAGLNQQFDHLAEQLRKDGFVESTRSSGNWGRHTERITAVCYGDSTSARSLAYLFRKRTGIAVDVKVLQPGDAMPAGKVVLLDGPSRLPPKLREFAEGTARVYKPASLFAFQEGINLIHTGAAPADPGVAAEQLRTAVETAKKHGRRALPHFASGEGPATDAEWQALKQSLDRAANHESARCEAKAFLYFLRRAERDGVPAQEAAKGLASTAEFISLEKMAEQSWELHTKLLEGSDGLAKVKANKLVYLIDPKVDSNSLVVDLIRMTNSDPARPIRVLTFEQAMNLKEDGVTFVYANDMHYSGRQGATVIARDLARLAGKAQASGGQVVVGTLAAYKEGLEAVRQVADKHGIKVVNVDEYQQAGREPEGSGQKKPRAPAADKGAVSEGQRAEGSATVGTEGNRARRGQIMVSGVVMPDVTSHVVLRYMRSNTTDPALSDFLDFVGMSPAHNESRTHLLDALSAGNGKSDLAARRQQVAKLLSPLTPAAVRTYTQTLSDEIRNWQEEIKSASDAQFALQEGVHRFLRENPHIAWQLNLGERPIHVTFGGMPDTQTRPLSDDAVVISLDGRLIKGDPGLKNPATVQRVQMEILRQLMQVPVEGLAGAIDGVDRAVLNEAAKGVIESKVRLLDSYGKAGFAVKGVANVGKVNDLVWRGAAPQSEEAVGRLRELGCDLIIDLRQSSKGSERAWCERHGIEYVNKPLSTQDLSKEQIADVLRIIKEANARGKKVFVHCAFGRDRTGIVIANLRGDEGWSPDVALAEMKAYGYTTETKGAERLMQLLPADPPVQAEGPGGDARASESMEAQVRALEGKAANATVNDIARSDGNGVARPEVERLAADRIRIKLEHKVKIPTADGEQAVVAIVADTKTGEIAYELDGKSGADAKLAHRHLESLSAALRAHQPLAQDREYVDGLKKRFGELPSGGLERRETIIERAEALAIFINHAAKASRTQSSSDAPGPPEKLVVGRQSVAIDAPNLPVRFRGEGGRVSLEPLPENGTSRVALKELTQEEWKRALTDEMEKLPADDAVRKQCEESLKKLADPAKAPAEVARLNALRESVAITHDTATGELVVRRNGKIEAKMAPEPTAKGSKGGGVRNIGKLGGPAVVALTFYVMFRGDSKQPLQLVYE